jgi:hypothetical protein
MQSNATVFVENRVEVSYAMEHGAVSCEFVSVATQQENKPCSEYIYEEVRLDGEIDWQILDASLFTAGLCRPLRT